MQVMSMTSEHTESLKVLLVTFATNKSFLQPFGLDSLGLDRGNPAGAL